MLRNDEVEETFDVFSFNGDIVGKLCGSRIPGRAVEVLELGILLDLPGDGMFSATGPDDKYFQFNRAVLSSSGFLFLGVAFVTVGIAL